MATRKTPSKKRPVVVLQLKKLDDFWAYLSEHAVTTLFVSAELEAPVPNPPPSQFGAYYLWMTALVTQSSTTHLVQYVEPMIGLDEIEEMVRPTETAERIEARLGQVRQIALGKNITTRHGRWREL